MALKEALGKGLVLIVPILTAALIAGSISSLLPAILAKKSGGRTAVPLPNVPRISFSSSILKITGMILALLVSLLIIRSHAGALASSMEGNGSAAIDLFNGLLGLLAAGGVVMILAGLADQAIKRHTLWRLLHLSRSEAGREQRMTGGDRATRTASLRRHRKEAAK